MIIGNGNRTKVNVRIVVQRTRMAQTEISILCWYWHTITQTHSGVRLWLEGYRPSCRLIQVCSLWLESDPSYHAHWWSVVCWRYFHWIWFKSSQNLRISLWSPLAITKTTRSVSISASHSPRFCLRLLSRLPWWRHGWRIITWCIRAQGSSLLNRSNQRKRPSQKRSY